MTKTSEINWHDADGGELRPGFYKHIDSGEVIELNVAAAGFRMTHGKNGEHGNIFPLSDGKKYRRMEYSQIQDEQLASTGRRAKWLETGLMNYDEDDLLDEAQGHCY